MKLKQINKKPVIEEIPEPVEQPVYQEPVTQAKPKVAKPARKRASRRTVNEAKRNQMGFDFDDADVENDLPSMSATDEPKALAKRTH